MPLHSLLKIARWRSLRLTNVPGIPAEVTDQVELRGGKTYESPFQEYFAPAGIDNKVAQGDGVPRVFPPCSRTCEAGPSIKTFYTQLLYTL